MISHGIWNELCMIINFLKLDILRDRMNQSEPTYNGLPQSSVVNNNRVSSPSYSVHRQHHYHARQQRRQSRSISPIDYRQKAVYYQQERSSRHYSPNRPIRRDPNTYYPVSTRSPSPPRYSRRSPSPIRYKQAAHHHYQRPSLNHSPPNKIGYSNGSVYFENPPENKVLAVFGLGRTCQPSDLMRAFHKYNCYDCKIIIDKRVITNRTIYDFLKKIAINFLDHET